MNATDATEKETLHVTAKRVVAWLMGAGWQRYMAQGDWATRAVKRHAMAVSVKDDDAQLACLLDNTATALTACVAAHEALVAYAKTRAEVA